MRRIVKNYEIIRPLGAGGMGSVYYAIEVQLNREVALKSLRQEIASNPGVMGRFKAEAQAQAQLNHPNVAHLYEFFQFGAEYFMAMEYVNGPTLSKVLEDRKRLPYEEAAGYAIQALQGLDHAHKHNIVHRDVKPANLMLNREGQVKVTDFGIARVNGSSRATRAGMIVGTYEYISPEAAQGLATTALSDIYSMAVVLFELITGLLPFQSENEYELLRMHIQAPRPSVRSAIKDVPSALDEIVQKAMDRNVRRRYRSADEMATALQKCIDRCVNRTTPLGISWFQKLVGDASHNKTPLPDVPQDNARRTAVTVACRRIEDLVEQCQWSEAGAAIDAGLRAYPGEVDLIELANRLVRQRQQYEKSIAQQAELVRDLLAGNLPEAAAKAIESALLTYPQAPALLELQNECNRRLELASATAAQFAEVQNRVDEFIDAGKFQEGADYVLELHGGSLDQNELGKLLARVLQARRDSERRVAIAHDLTRASEAAEARDWDRALDILDRALARFPAEPNLETYRAELAARRAVELRDRAVAALIAEAHEAEERGALQDARDRIAGRLDSLDNDARLVGELNRLDTALEAARKEAAICAALTRAAELRAARKWREAIELLDRTSRSEGTSARLSDLVTVIRSELQKHQAQVDSAAAQARRLILNGRWEDAVLRLSADLRELPAESVLADILQDALRGLEQQRREKAITSTRQQAETHAGACNYSEALKLLGAALAQHPDEPSLTTLLSRITLERDAWETRQKAAAAIDKAAALREAGNFPGAIAVLQAALRETPQVDELGDALAALELEWTDISHRNGLQEIERAVQSAQDSGQFEGAAEAVVKGLQAWPNDAGILLLQQRLQAAARESAVRAAVDSVLKVAGALGDKDAWEEASKAYEATLADFPETAPDLEPRLATARALAVEARAQARIVELDRNITDYVGAGLISEAALEVLKAEREFVGQAVVLGWRKKVEEGRHQTALAGSIQDAVDRSRRAIQSYDFDGAEAVLREAQGPLVSHPVLRVALDAVERARADRTAAIDAALDGIRKLLAAGDWDHAISRAVAASEKYPEEPRFKALPKEASQQREAQLRRADIEARAAHFRKRLAEQALDAAEALLASAVRDYPNEQIFTALDRELEQERHKAAAAAKQSVQEAAGRIATAEQSIRTAIDVREYQRALAEAEHALAVFPKERKLLVLRAAIAAAIEENGYVRAVVAEVTRLLSEGKPGGAEHSLVEALRRLPSRSELLELRNRVDAARTAEWEGKERLASLLRTVAEIKRLLGASRTAEAAAALRELQTEFGMDAAPEVAKLVEERELAEAEGRVAEVVTRIEQVPRPPRPTVASPSKPASPAPSDDMRSVPVGTVPELLVVHRRRPIVSIAAAAAIVVAGGLAVRTAVFKPNPVEPRSAAAAGVDSSSEVTPAGVPDVVALTASPADVRFEYQNGQRVPVARTVHINPETDLHVEVTVGSSWLKAEAAGRGKLLVSVRMEQASIGLHSGTVVATPASGRGAPVRIPVSLNFHRMGQ